MTQALRVHRTEASDSGIALPAYETEGSAGMDLRANYPADMRQEGVVLAVGARAR